MSPAPAPAVYTLSLEEIAPHCYNIQKDGFYLLCLIKDLGELSHQDKVGHHKVPCVSEISYSLAQGQKASPIFLLCLNTAILPVLG